VSSKAVWSRLRIICSPELPRLVEVNDESKGETVSALQIVNTFRPSPDATLPALPFTSWADLRPTRPLPCAQRLRRQPCHHPSLASAPQSRLRPSPHIGRPGECTRGGAEVDARWMSDEQEVEDRGDIGRERCRRGEELGRGVGSQSVGEELSAARDTMAGAPQILMRLATLVRSAGSISSP